MLRLAVLTCFAVLLVTRDAAAEWHFTPFGGVTMLGNTSIFDPEQGTGERHLHGGLGVAWLSRGIFGVEGTVTWTRDFFEARPSFSDFPEVARTDFVTSSRTVSAMANVVVTLPQRWTEYALRPIVSGGVGLLHAHASSNQAVFPVNVNTSGFNIGGGAVGFLTQRTGVRFDVRYHSTLNRSGEAPSFGPVHLRYVTASIGLVLRR